MPYKTRIISALMHAYYCKCASLTGLFAFPPFSDDFSDCCTYDEMVSGCRHEKSTEGMECLCGIGCKREFPYKNMAECEAKLRSKLNRRVRRGLIKSSRRFSSGLNLALLGSKQSEENWIKTSKAPEPKIVRFSDARSYTVR